MKKLVIGLFLFMMLLVGVIAFRVWLSIQLDEGVVAYKQERYQDSFKILLPLAKIGNSNAQKIIGLSYAYGHGVEVDSEKAKELLLKDEINAEFMFKEIGLNYKYGKGKLKPNQKLSQYWISLSEKQ